MVHYSTPIPIVIRNLLAVFIASFMYVNGIVVVDTQHIFDLATTNISGNVCEDGTENLSIVPEKTTAKGDKVVATIPESLVVESAAVKSPVVKSPAPKKVAKKPAKKVKYNASLPTPRRYYSDYEIVIWMLKSFESFSEKSFWDHSQWSVGWGTKSKKGVVFTVKDADTAFLEHFNKVYNKFIAEYPNIAEDKLLAQVLANGLYNVGSYGDGMNRLLKTYKKGDLDTKKRICAKLKQYHRASGKVLPGLVRRRNAECRIILADEITKQQLGEYYRIKVENILSGTK